MQDFRFPDDLVRPSVPKTDKNKKKGAAAKTTAQNETKPEDKHCTPSELLEALKADYLLPLGSSYLTQKWAPYFSEPDFDAIPNYQRKSQALSGDSENCMAWCVRITQWDLSLSTQVHMTSFEQLFHPMLHFSNIRMVAISMLRHVQFWSCQFCFCSFQSSV